MLDSLKVICFLVLISREKVSTKIKIFVEQILEEAQEFERSDEQDGINSL